jgi:hypothetical protein
MFDASFIHRRCQLSTDKGIANGTLEETSDLLAVIKLAVEQQESFPVRFAARPLSRFFVRRT